MFKITFSFIHVSFRDFLVTSETSSIMSEAKNSGLRSQEYTVKGGEKRHFNSQRVSKRMHLYDDDSKVGTKNAITRNLGLTTLAQRIDAK